MATVVVAGLLISSEGDAVMLEWMGKKKVVNHHNEVPFHVLERKWSFGGGPRSVAAENGDTDATERVPPRGTADATERVPPDRYLLGTAFGVAYYFCYEKGAVVTLNRSLLKKIKTKAESYVIYADICTLSAAELEKYHITFKKIPRDITRF